MRIVRLTLGLLVVAAVVIFLCEDIAVAHHIPPYRHPIGEIQVHRTYLLHKAREKVTILPAEWQSQDCVRAIFPHGGHPPCWWVAHHIEQEVEMQ